MNKKEVLTFLERRISKNNHNLYYIVLLFIFSVKNKL